MDDKDPVVGDWDQEPIDHDIINTISEVMQMIITQPEAQVQLEEDEEEQLQNDPGDIENSHMDTDLMEDEADNEIIEEDCRGAMMEQDSDLINLSDEDVEPRKSIAKRKTPDFDDAASEESCQKIHMEKHRDGVHIELTYLTSHKPSPYELLQMMKVGNTALSKGKIASETFLTENKVLISLTGCDRTSFLDGKNLWSWLPKNGSHTQTI